MAPCIYVVSILYTEGYYTLREQQPKQNRGDLQTTHTHRSLTSLPIIVSQLSADHRGLGLPEFIVTHCPVLLVETDLKSPVGLVESVNQPHITIITHGL